MIIFLTGGARSGKSTFALKLADGLGTKTAFLATGQAHDAEMERRIALHKKVRPRHWITIEEPLHISHALETMNPKIQVIIIDCLTLLISNLLLAGKSEKLIIKEIKSSLKIMKKSDFTTIIVSNEVGCGIVPENKLARDFRDIAGAVNQLAAQASDKAYTLISGFPVQLK
ncbi:MAG: hypothetical protein A2219_02285 [Elusimicrobia bacterium RIFOXYA2_FULL_50_26]|nr:MAG: hypothetical protein A2219_02285 [Elusimicrobia bacterium RIFOXYA2_FULL_50_26]OGS24463.1 MAG: hypothetical protein A2314_06190 [Elusimicrobia bacterium RIFOXYB2_FULL_50_12]